MSSSTFAAAYADQQSKARSAGDWEAAIEASNRVTRPLAAQLLEQIGLGSPRDRPFRLLDHACGAGATGSVVRSTMAPEVLQQSSVLSADLAPGMVELVKDRQAREGWVNSEARVLDAQKTDLPDASFSHVTLGMALHITPQPQQVLKESIRLLQPGGVVGLSVATRIVASHMHDVAEAFASFPFDAPYPDPFPSQLHDVGRWWDYNWVRGNLEDEHGLEDVRVELHSRLIRYEDGADWIGVFGGFLPAIINGWWPEETRKAHPVEEVKGLMVEFLDRKYENRPWYSDFFALVASGRKKGQ